MKKLQDFANESLNPDQDFDQDFDLIFDEFVNELESDDDKSKAADLKESWKRKFAGHARTAGHAVKGFLRKMWDDDHVDH